MIEMIRPCILHSSILFPPNKEKIYKYIFLNPNLVLIGNIAIGLLIVCFRFLNIIFKI